MPDLAGAFAKAADNAVVLAVAGERARILLSSFRPHVEPLFIDRLELLYEMAYLRVFIGWEVFLEESFLRYLCGYASTAGAVAMVSGAYFPTLAAAEQAVLAGQQYKLWHDPVRVVQRARGFLINGLHEQIISSNLSRLDQFARIRHRIAHAQQHARVQFDAVTMNLAARRYKGGRPGKFLRDWVTPTERWLDVIAAELKSLAVQITP